MTKMKCNPQKNKLQLEFQNITPKSKLGLGDCIQLMDKIGEHCIDLILTDPPFNLGQFMHNRNTNLIKMRENQFAYAGWDNLNYTDWLQNMDGFFYRCNKTLKKRGGLLLFMSLIKIESVIKLAEKHGFYYKTVGIWHKTNPMPRNMNLHFVNSTEAWVYFINEGTTGTFNNNSKVIHDFIESSLTPKNEKRYGKHPTQKPLKVINHFISLLSNENDIVCDPFMGSGSTGVGCELLKRKFIGIELNKEYFELARKRITTSDEKHECY